MTQRLKDSPAVVVRKFLEVVRSGHAPERAQEFMAQLVSAHQVRSDEPSTIQRTPADYAEHVREMKVSYGDFRLTIEEIIADGDKVYVRWSQHGLHLGEIEGHAPTGRPLVEVASCVYRVTDELITEYWIQVDDAGMTAQLSRIT